MLMVGTFVEHVLTDRCYRLRAEVVPRRTLINTRSHSFDHVEDQIVPFCMDVFSKSKSSINIKHQEERIVDRPVAIKIAGMP